MTCGTCIRWRRLIPPQGQRTSRYGYCRAPRAKHPLWLDARYPHHPDGTPMDGAEPPEHSPLMPDMDGRECRAFKEKKKR